MRLTYNACREYSTVEMAEVLYVHCLKTLYGRYIAIQLSGISSLYICEIEIYEKSGKSNV